MVYFAAGVSGLTSVVGAFFLKDYLSLSASFVAGLAFWAGLPWILKVPMGHIVDLFWKWKGVLILAGAGLITMSLLIMFGLVSRPEEMRAVFQLETWYVIALLLAPSGYAIQDVVADAMTVEAVPKADRAGQVFSVERSRAMHTTMQTLGRIAIISGFVSVAAVNIYIFSDAETLPREARLDLYARVYLTALAIPVISVSGMLLHSWMQHRQAAHKEAVQTPENKTIINWQILGRLGFCGTQHRLGHVQLHLCAGNRLWHVAGNHSISDPPTPKKLRRQGCPRVGRNRYDHFRVQGRAASRSRPDLVRD